MKFLIFLFLLAFVGVINCSEDYKLEKACPDKTCVCDIVKFSQNPDRFEISCPEQYKTIKFRFSPPNEAVFDCLSNRNVLEKLPRTSIGIIEKVLFTNCHLNDGEISKVLENVGITDFKSVFIDNDQSQNEFVVDKGLFYGLEGKNVTKLGFGRSNRIKIMEDAFVEMKNINWLELKSSQIEGTKNTLQKLLNLETLQVMGPDWKNFEISNLTSVKSLTLWRTKIEEIFENDFDNFSSLEDLDLESNEINTINENAFSALRNLIKINLSTNNFSKLPGKLLSSTKKLRNFKLGFNKQEMELEHKFFANLKSLTSVQMENSQLKLIPDDLFENSTNLTLIEMQHNRISSLNKDLFKGLNQLESVSFNYNNISVLEDDLFVGCESLRVLDLSNNKINSIPSGLFRENVNLEELYMSHNHLTHIEDGTFKNNLNLFKVNFFFNKISFNCENSKDDCKSPFYRQTKMKLLTLGRNAIQSFNSDFAESMTELEHLDLSYNLISYLNFSKIRFNGKQLVIDVRLNKITDIDFDNFENGEKREIFTTINLNYNPLDCHCSIFKLDKYLKRTDRLFKVLANNLVCFQPEKPENCQYLNGTCPENCRCGLKLDPNALLINCSSSNLKSLSNLPSLMNYTILDISNNSISDFTSIAKLPEFSQVRELYASGNNFSTMFSMENVPENITVLDISRNNFSILRLEDVNVLGYMKKLRSLLLSGNPWNCSCDLKSLFEFIDSSSGMINNYQFINCSNGNPFYNVTLGELCPQKHPSFILLLCAVILIITLFIVGLMFFKYHEEVKIWLFWNNYFTCCFKTGAVLTVLSNKTFDAFISYSQKDEAFVMEDLIPGLEEIRHFNLNISKFDWNGEFTKEQIISSMSDSRETIIFLSRNYIRSVWGTPEFRDIHRDALDKHSSEIIVIIYEDIEEDSVDNELRELMDKNVCLEYDDPWFWERLHYTLRIKNQKQ